MLKYFVKSRKSPINGEVKYYAQMASPDRVTLNAIAKRIAQTCTLTRHDIVACLSAFQEALINDLQEGKSVRLDDLGCFRVTLKSKGTATEKEFNSASVQAVRIRFTPSARLRKALAVGADGVSLSQLSVAPEGTAPQDPVPETPGPEAKV